MAQLIFKRGSLANLNNLEIKDGQFIVTTDEGALYVDNGSTRVRLGDFIVVENVAALPAAGANRKAMYYCEAENVLARWNGTDWVQINKQPTTAELKVKLGLDAEGEVTAAIAAAKKAGTDAQTATDNLNTYVGTFTHDTAKTVVEYINAKTDGIATSGNLETLAGRVTAVEGDVATIKGDYLKSTDKTELEGKITAAQTAADNAQLHSDGVASDLAGHEADAVAHITAAEREAWSGKTTMAEVEAKGYLVAADISGKADASQVAIDIADAVKVETDARVAADEAIEAKIGTVADGKTVVDMIADAQTAATYDDAEVRGLIAQEVTDREEAVAGLKTNLEDQIATKVDQDAYNTKIAALEDEDERLAGLIDDNTEAIEGIGAKVDALVGEDVNKSVRTIANEELAARLIAEDAAEALDTLEEIAAWIQAHPGDAATMNAAIEALQTKVNTGDQTVSAYVAAAIAALNIGDYALAADLTALAGRVTNLETASATHALKTEVEAVADALNEYKEAHKDDYDNTTVDAKVKAVQDQIDVLNDTYATDAELADAIAAEVKRADDAYAGKAYEATVDGHVADTVAHITADERTAWNGAQAAAEATAAAALEAARTEIAAAISTAKGEAIADAEGKIATAVDTVKTDASNKDAVVLAEAQEGIAAAKTELQGNIDTHVNNADIHVTVADKEKWNAAQENAEKTANDALIAALTWGEF